MLKAENRYVPGFTKEDGGGTWNGQYVFVHGTDPQFGFIDERARGGEGLVWDEEIKLLEKAVEAVNLLQPRPKFFFINGDLVHALPGSGPHKNAQEKDFLAIISKSEVPILLTSGNHDIGNEPTSKTIDNFTRLFGDDYFSFYVGGVFYIALNSQYLYDNSIMKEKADEQMEWMKGQLEKAKEEGMKHTVIFMHIPLFTSLPDENDRHTNIPTEMRMMLLNEFADAGVEIVFSGHYHRNAGGVWEKTSGDGKERKIEVVVTSAIGMQLGNDKSGLCIVNVDENDISHRYYSLENIPQKL